MRIIYVSLLCLLLCSCSFEPRSPKAFPDELKQIHYVSAKQSSPLSIQLRALLHSMHASILPANHRAAVTLSLSNDHFSYSRPDIIDSTLPSVINFSQSATVKLINDKTHHIIAEKTFITSQSITINANQIYTRDANNTVRAALTEQMITFIYYWITSSNTKAALHEQLLDQR